MNSQLRHTPRTHTAHGFTLVELLVVIAIIIALVAILIPAMNKALYAAQLASCGSNLRQVALAALNGASDNYGRFPQRKIAETNWPAYNWLQHTTVSGSPNKSDDRPMFRKYTSIETFQCPLSPFPQPNMLDTAKTYQVQGSYEMYFSIWLNSNAAERATSAGFFRVSDQPVYTKFGESHRFNVLAGDLDFGWDGGGGVYDRYMSHPSRSEPASVPYQSYDTSGNVVNGGTASIHRAFVYERGVIDRNFARIDASVYTMADVTARDDRLFKTWFRPGNPSDPTHGHLPKM